MGRDVLNNYRDRIEGVLLHCVCQSRLLDLGRIGIEEFVSAMVILDNEELEFQEYVLPHKKGYVATLTTYNGRKLIERTYMFSD